MERNMKRIAIMVLLLAWLLVQLSGVIAEEAVKKPNLVEEKLEIPIADGPFQPTWESLQKGYECPQWFRDAKFGIWAHWGPQAVLEAGDWNARGMYEQQAPWGGYDAHLKLYGHPSVHGFKDVLPCWKAEKWDPEKLMALYKKAGAKYFMAMGAHHDNFDCWDSKYQPWNSVKIGPKKDVVGLWQNAARKQGMHFGVSVHADYAWWWFQIAFGSDKNGDKKGVPYDAKGLTKESGKGTWWEGLDPKDLYGIDLSDERTKGIWNDEKERAGDSRYGGMADEISNKEYARWYCNKWFNRMKDLVDNYHPDLLYFDGGGGEYYPFSGYGTGRGFKSDAMQRITAHLYNDSAKRNNGRVDAVMNIKTDKGKALVLDFEGGFPRNMRPFPWQTDITIGDWFYRPGMFYDTRSVIITLLEIVARNGNMMLNVPLNAAGEPDSGGVEVCENMGKWLTVNGDGIYGTHAWGVFREGINGMPGGNFNESQAKKVFNATDIRFTAKADAVYAFALAWPTNGQFVVRSLGKPLTGTGNVIDHVSLLGSGGKLKWKQTEDGLVITSLPEQQPCEYAFCFKVEGKDLAPVPMIVRPGTDGLVKLLPGESVLHGNHEMGEKDGMAHVGYWLNNDDYLTWRMEVPAPGTYRMTICTAAPASGVEFVFEAAGAAPVINVQTHEDYAEYDVGTIKFRQAGIIDVKLRPGKNWERNTSFRSLTLRKS